MTQANIAFGAEDDEVSRTLACCSGASVHAVERRAPLSYVPFILDHAVFLWTSLFSPAGSPCMLLKRPAFCRTAFTTTLLDKAPQASRAAATVSAWQLWAMHGNGETFF
jgi:hypothetical protein